jgi:biopolymer transport protein ExbD
MAKHKYNRISPDLTPLIDVVFILLIFFIVTSVFKKEELSLVLNLPDSSAIVLQVEIKDVSIELSKNELAIYGKKVLIVDFDRELGKIKNKERNIILRIDENVNYKRIVKVLDSLKKYELNNLSLVTTNKK